jgi:carbonic anhydrase
MDARLDLFGILGLEAGDAHLIRNAGGVATDDVIRSLTISQRKLGTREVILVHHTDCGMLTFTEDELRNELLQETGVKPPWSAETFTDLDADVRSSMQRIRTSPYIPHRDRVRGFVYDVDTGVLREVT